MRIAQIAPLWEGTGGGGISDPERAVSYLTRELIRRRHEVSLFSGADSETSPTLEAMYGESDETQFSRGPATWSRADAMIMAAEQVFGERADEFDIIHSHFGIDGLPMARRCPIPTVTTLQDRLDYPAYIPVFKQFLNLPLVSTSDTQRRPLPWASWYQTIYPGVPSELYRFNQQPGKYLAFFGSLSLKEGLGQAIELARRAHLPLRVASPQDGIGVPFWSSIELLSTDSDVEWLGELRGDEKSDFLRGALAYVCTHDWPGPSGLCVGEALACGTPILAFHGGSAAEMIYDHVTGFACQSLDEMVDVLPLIGNLDRRECRGVFEKRFSAERMTDQYLQLYERLIAAARPPRVFGAAAQRR